MVDVKRWDELVSRAGVLAGYLAQVQAKLVDLTRDLIDSGDWAGSGVNSVTHWLEIYCGISPAMSRDLVRVAQRGDLAEAMAWMRQGRVGLDQVVPIARHVPASSVAPALMQVETATVAQVRKLVASYPFNQAPPIGTNTAAADTGAAGTGAEHHPAGYCAPGHRPAASHRATGRRATGRRAPAHRATARTPPYRVNRGSTSRRGNPEACEPSRVWPQLAGFGELPSASEQAVVASGHETSCSRRHHLDIGVGRLLGCRHSRLRPR